MENKIMLVDDEPNILKSLKRLFMDDSYDILAFDSPVKALSKMEGIEPAVVISDQRMEEMEGTKFLTKVKEKRSNTVCIILSGFDAPDAVISAINQGHIDHFIRKPWDNIGLKLQVKNAVEHYKLISGLYPVETEQLDGKSIEDAYLYNYNELLIMNATYICDLCNKKFTYGKIYKSNNFVYLCSDCFKQFEVLPDEKIKESIANFIIGNVI